MINVPDDLSYLMANHCQRACRVRARINPRPHRRGTRTRQGAGAEFRATVQAHPAPAARGLQAARQGRGNPCGDRPQLQGQRRDDFEGVVTLRKIGRSIVGVRSTRALEPLHLAHFAFGIHGAPEVDQVTIDFEIDLRWCGALTFLCEVRQRSWVQND